MPRLNHKGIVHPTLLLILIGIGIAIYFLIASTVPLASNLLNTLYPKSAPQAVGETLEDTIIVNPTVPSYYLDWGYYYTFGSGKMAEFGNISLMMYRVAFNNAPWIYFRDNSTGSTSHVNLPDFPSESGAEYILTSLNEFWLFSGVGVNSYLIARQYQLTGSPLPTSASLVSTKTFGGIGNRPKGMIKLKSGGLVFVWDIQSSDYAPHDLHVTYRSPSGIWSTVTVQAQTTGGRTTLAQHPADESIWVFNNGDAASRIETFHFTENPSGLTLDWEDHIYIATNGPGGSSDIKDGDNGPDPENPYIVAAADPTHNAILLAYESAHRKIVSTAPFIAISYPNIAVINADATKTFIVYPTWVERTDTLGLVATSDKIWLMYRPVDETTFVQDKVYLNSYSNGSWGTPLFVGTLGDFDWKGYGLSRAEFAYRPNDNRFHYYRVLEPGMTPFPTPLPTPTPSPTQLPTPTPIPPTSSPTSNPTASAFSINNIKVTSISPSRATISWISSVPSSSQVEYGVSSNNLNLATPIDNKLVTTHKQTLSNLAKKTTYYFRVKSKNSQGLEMISSTQSFNTK